MSERMRTHSMGVMCIRCHDVLVPDNCSCGTPHGHTYQEAGEWAARTWPDHPCFETGPSNVLPFPRRGY